MCGGGGSLIYLDNSATTVVSPQAAQQALLMMTQQFGNPSSLHRVGFAAEQAVREARRSLCGALLCREGELYFTSGGTEANNWAIIGTALSQRRRGNKVVVSAIEHSSVLAAAERLERAGFEVVRILPDRNGVIGADQVSAAVDENTVLLSVMLVNNEVGSVMDVATLAAAARRKNPKIVVHSDAVQAFGKIPVQVGRLGVDLLSISAHKIHGMKGTGALFVRKGTRIEPIIFGGEQQNRMRPGTENVPGIVCFGAACRQAVQQLSENLIKVRGLRDRLQKGLSAVPGVVINSPDDACPYILNFSTRVIRSETLLHFLEQREIYVSSGSACAKGHRSHVLTAMGLDDLAADTAIRVSFCAENTEEDVDALLDAVQKAGEEIQKIHP